jgi:homoserine kinase
MNRKSDHRRHVGRFEIALPATSANLGSAFDAAALALKMFLSVQAVPASKFSVVARGRDAAICGQLDDHLILTTYREVLQAEGKNAPPLALEIENEIPIGKGCGSSAAARLAGIALAVHFGKLGWNDSRIVGEAARREHHPDNASACWMGGFTVARMSGVNEVSMATIQPKGMWPLLLVVPKESLATEAARRVLPQQYSRADAVANVQNSMLLLAGFIQGRGPLVSAGLGDRLHQPYRAALCPLLPALQDLSGTPGILGVALSGAGPSVLVLVDGLRNVARARKRVKGQLAKSNLSAELIQTEITARGVRRKSS